MKVFVTEGLNEDLKDSLGAVEFTDHSSLVTSVEIYEDGGHNYGGNGFVWKIESGAEGVQPTGECTRVPPQDPRTLNTRFVKVCGDDGSCSLSEMALSYSHLLQSGLQLRFFIANKASNQFCSFQTLFTFLIYLWICSVQVIPVP